MREPGESPPQAVRWIDAEERDAALNVLGNVVKWQHAPVRWVEIEAALGAVEAAVAAGDPEGFSRSTADLELLGPPRITRISGVKTEPVPAALRTRANQLVHTLEAASPKTARDGDDGDAGGDDEGRGARSQGGGKRGK